MLLLSSVSVFLAFAYMWVMTAYVRGWNRLPEQRPPEDFIPALSVTVIIPARNEAANIGPCLASIVNGAYPHKLLNIMVVDDFSADDTASEVQEFLQNNLSPAGPSIALISLPEHLPETSRFTPNKKKGIELAVSLADTPLIVTTDADCVSPPDWLRQIAWQFESRPELSILTGPVLCEREANLFHYFQSLDILGFAGITGAGYELGWHRMGNGANLAYRRQAFLEAKGYAGNEGIASGDDMFLLQKIGQTGACGFLKSPAMVVHTEAQPDWNHFWQQRIRWGGKNAAMPEWPIRLVLLLVFTFCCWLWALLIFAFAGLVSWPLVFISWTVKWWNDYFFLNLLAKFFRRKDLMRYFLPSFFLHTGYIPLAGLGSLLQRRYVWKGRRV